MSSDATLTTGRVLAATPTEVLAAFADPERLARWWGPNGLLDRLAAELS